MKRFAFVWLIIVGLSMLVDAQSGRKVVTETQPNTSVLKTNNSSTEISNSSKDTPKPDETQSVDYSESTPNSSRSIKLSPVLNSDNNQSKKSDKKSKNQSTQEIPPIEEVEIVKVKTNLISIPVSVFDRDGLYIPNLHKDDFKIFEDGNEQEVAYFGTTEKPFTVVLLIDVSPSTAYKIEEIQNAAIAFVDQLKIQDSVMVIEFDKDSHTLADVTNNRDKIYKAIRKADFGGGTSLYNAVDYTLRKRLGKIEGRKAIVLFTDGVDTTSDKSSYESTLSQAEESEAMIFPIYYNTFLDNQKRIGAINLPFPIPNGRTPIGTKKEDYELGRKYLDELSTVTGGRVFLPDSTPGGLTKAFEGIAEELRRQYNIGYYPTEEGQAGQRKQIKVRVNHPKLIVRARDSYIVGADSPEN